MTLSSRLDDLTTSAFLNTDLFAETVTFYPGGDAAKAQSIQVIWFEDSFEGTNQVPGDGPVVSSKRDGELFRGTVKLEMAASIDVDELWRPKDMFKRSTGEVCTLKRIDAKDAHMQTVQCVLVSSRLTKRNRLRA